jgi:hypothetical protein
MKNHAKIVMPIFTFDNNELARTQKKGRRLTRCWDSSDSS